MPGTIIPAIAFFGVAQLSSDQKYLSIALITAAVAMVEVAIIGGYTYSTMDLAPNFIGILSGINNTIGLASGFIIPVIISLLTSDVSFAVIHVKYSPIKLCSCSIFVTKLGNYCTMEPRV